MKMQQSQPHGLREPLAKKCNIALWLCTFLFPHLLEVGRSTVEPKYAINYCNLLGSRRACMNHDRTSNPKHHMKFETLWIFQILQKLQILQKDTPETSDTPDIEIAKSPDTPDCWLLLVVLACGKLVSKTQIKLSRSEHRLESHCPSQPVGLAPPSA